MQKDDTGQTCEFVLSCGGNNDFDVRIYAISKTVEYCREKQGSAETERHQPSGRVEQGVLPLELISPECIPL